MINLVKEGRPGDTLSTHAYLLIIRSYTRKQQPTTWRFGVQMYGPGLARVYLDLVVNLSSQR